MAKQLGELDPPNLSTDDIYGEVMKPHEGDMDMFHRHDVKVTPYNVSISGSECSETEVQQQAVMAQLIEAFPEEARAKTILVIDHVEIDGTEGFGERAKTIIGNLIKFIKDIMVWIGELINNKLTRLDNRRFRVQSRRKRFGLKTIDVKYPSSVKRLVVPNKVTEDGQWVAESLGEVHNFYRNVVNAHKAMEAEIQFKASQQDVSSLIGKVNGIIKSAFGMTEQGSQYVSPTLPGNRSLVYQPADTANPGPVELFFNTTTAEVKLRSPTFGPTSFIIDRTLGEIADTIDTIRKNQKSVSELHRRFEKQINQYLKDNQEIKADERGYLMWLGRLSKQLTSVGIQYTSSSLDAGLNFVEAGIAE